MVFGPQDKRRFPRVDLRLPIHYQIRGKPELTGAMSNNISSTGICLSNNEFIAPSTVVMLSINILSRLIRPIGKVVWSWPLPHSDRNRLGIQFLEIDPIENNYLKDYLTMQLDNL